MAEKSPRLHPIRHRNVLTPARFQVGLELQNPRDNTGSSLFWDFAQWCANRIVVSEAGIADRNLWDNEVALGSWRVQSSLVGRTTQNDMFAWVSVGTLYFGPVYGSFLSMAALVSLGVRLWLRKQARYMRPQQEYARHGYSTEIATVKSVTVHAPPKREKSEE